MVLQIYDNKLLLVSGDLANDPDCCCGSGCDCSEAEESPANDACACLEEDYGTTKMFGNVVVTVSGQPDAVCDLDAFRTFPPDIIGSCNETSPPAKCADPSGTYVFPCDFYDEQEDYCFHVLVCTREYDNGFGLITRIDKIFLEIAISGRHTPGYPYAGIGSGLRGYSYNPTTTPEPTLICSPVTAIAGEPRRFTRWSINEDRLETWGVVFDENCTEECAYPIGVNSCNLLETTDNKPPPTAPPPPDPGPCYCELPATVTIEMLPPTTA